jgi:hypothetical protein
MQSSSPTFSTPSPVTGSIFSCKLSKKDNSNICTPLLATDRRVEQSIIHNTQHRINQQKKKKKKKKERKNPILPNLEIQSEKINAI